MMLLPSMFIVYIDLNGVMRGAEIHAEDKMEVIACIENAYNQNLLWHFKIYGKNDDGNDTTIKYAELPWSLNSISQLISFIEMKKALEAKNKVLEIRKKKMIEEFSNPNTGTVSIRSPHVEEFTSREILRDALESLNMTLLDQGITSPEKFSADVIDALVYAQKISMSLSKAREFHLSGGSHPYSLMPTSYLTDEFISKLPKVEDIFPSNKSKEEWLRLFEN